MPELKFDLVMGNPPFHKGKNSSYYVDFIKGANVFTSNRSLLSYIIPNRILLPGHTANMAILSSFNPLFVKHTLTNFNVNTTVCYVVAVKGHYESQTICEFENKEYHRIDLDSPTPTSDPRYQVKQLSDKVIRYKRKIEFTTLKPKTNYIFVKRQWKRFSSQKDKGGCHVFQDSTEENDGRYFSVSSKQDRKTLLWYLTKSKVVRFLTCIYASSMNVPPFLWKCIPYLPLFTTTDKEVYEKLNLTEADIALMNEVLKET